MTPDQFHLTKSERDAPVWHRLMRHLEEKRAELRAKNDGDLDAIKTANMRGQIAQISAILDLNKDRPVIDAGHHDQF